ncbi:ribbon-helix-helix domain-containing protein [Lichenifustis flavocetrariae]|uniref:Type II toxin-antitoxin system ParD family antitoxin n=1 Tax=Lichenifustis flavocetrariae TaxID=2949735 RepID=A0AA42CNQ3_9HYPH|nr:type II toxin-antitoxin system ParD family antitoxin [Lichenifustis flavocetrariae]MCW6509632.1 type II toxin-antitoxin system ParD family antitoxin [Lichenifustis flavocetrariae]
MPATYSRHIALTGPLKDWVDAQVDRGEYLSVSDLIRTAIRLLRERDEARIDRQPCASPGPSRGQGQV